MTAQVVHLGPILTSSGFRWICPCGHTITWPNDMYDEEATEQRIWHQKQHRKRLVK